MKMYFKTPVRYTFTQIFLLLFVNNLLKIFMHDIFHIIKGKKINIFCGETINELGTKKN